MKYSKGETIKIRLYNGDIKLALVLNNGVGGEDFFRKHGKMVWHFDYDLESLTMLDHLSDDFFNQHHVLYYVLIGDKKGWYTNLES